MADQRDLFEEARRLIAGARRVVALTGAGISAESGIPTFRGAGGLWRSYRAEDLATPEAFARDPELVWEWYHWRRGICAEARPNAGHLALVDLERRLGDGFTLITQNVDGLHRRAGSERVLALHGEIFVTRCSRCALAWPDEAVRGKPACSRCGALGRPGVVWFGESLDAGVLEHAFRAAEGCEVLLVIGTSSVVYPAAMLARGRVKGRTVLVVNPEATPANETADLYLRGPAGVVLPELIR